MPADACRWRASIPCPSRCGSTQASRWVSDGWHGRRKRLTGKDPSVTFAGHWVYCSADFVIIAIALEDTMTRLRAQQTTPRGSPGSQEHAQGERACPPWRSSRPASHAARLYSGWLPTHLGALCVVFGLLVSIAASAPHLVHHLDHQYKPTECLLFSLAHHSSVTKSVAFSLPIPLPRAEEPIVAQPLPTVEAPTCSFRSRAPPA